MLKISAATRERARKVNEGEQLRLGKVTRVMERHQRVADHAQTRVLERVQKQLQELQAFQVVLRDQYTVDKFRTLQTPPPRMSDRRRKLETMFYHSGFSQKAMQPEIRRQLKKMDPERVRRRFKRHLLESSRQEVVRLVVRNSEISSSFSAPADVTGNNNNSSSKDYFYTSDSAITTIAKANADAAVNLPGSSQTDRVDVEGDGTLTPGGRDVSDKNAT
nr:hypothetical protein BaRGS_029182 [Batillaria attramentaria]